MKAKCKLQTSAMALCLIARDCYCRKSLKSTNETDVFLQRYLFGYLFVQLIIRITSQHSVHYFRKKKTRETIPKYKSQLIPVNFLSVESVSISNICPRYYSPCRYQIFVLDIIVRVDIEYLSSIL